MGCAGSVVEPLVSDEEFRAHIDSLRTQYGMPHLSIVKRNDGHKILLAGGDAKAVASDLLSIVQRFVPKLEQVESDDPAYDVVIAMPTVQTNMPSGREDVDAFHALWARSWKNKEAFCDTGSMAVLDMLESHGYTLLAMQRESDIDKAHHQYIGAIFKKST